MFSGCSNATHKMAATSRYLPLRRVDVIVEEENGSSPSSDDEDFIAQEARISAEEYGGCGRIGNNSLTSFSRPKFCEGAPDDDDDTSDSKFAYGEAVAILDQAAQACDQEFADHYTTTSSSQKMTDLKFRPDPRYLNQGCTFNNRITFMMSH